MKDIKLHKEFGLNPTMSVCFLCGKEKGDIVLLGNAIKGEAERFMCVDRIPCEKCFKKYKLDKFILILEVSPDEQAIKNKEPKITGSFVTMADQDFIANFGEIKARFAYMDSISFQKVKKAIEKFNKNLRGIK